MHCKKLFVASIVALQIGSMQPVLASDDDTASGATKTLQGGVVEVGVTLSQLRDARLSISRVRKATANLFDEVSRQQMMMNYNPNVVGSMLIMAPRPSYTGPVLPPRQKWVDASMAEIRPIIKLFKEDVDIAIESNRRTDVREAARTKLDPLREEVFSLVKKSYEVFDQLEKLTAGPSYNNSAIASATRELDNSVKGLDRTLKRGVGILQKEARAAKRAAKT